MVNPALSSIVLAPLRTSSLQDRVAKVLSCSFGLQEKDFPADLRQDWRNLTAVWHRKNPKDRRWMKGANAKASTLKPTEAKQVLQSFLNIADAVIKRQGINKRARVGD
jgi:hypothetical protein